MKTNREYRNFAEDVELRAESENNYIVEGYASTFAPYVLFEMEGEKFSERIDPEAFRNADMSDVVFRIDHEGAVFARTSNNTIQLYPDDHGLHVRADLSRTEKARGIFEDIREGMYPKMSFAFVVEDDGDEYERETKTRVIYRIKKLFDVSPVSHPANPGTEIGVSMRDYFHGEMEKEKAERLERERKIKELELRIRLMKGR